MNIALIFAGGVGLRMGVGTPKQLLEVEGKPIIIYTLEQFSSHQEIDGIVVVFKEEYIDLLKELIIKWDIKKIVSITKGGSSGQESIYNGLKEVQKNYPDDSLVLIHDGVRPFITKEVISQNIDVARKLGSSITVSPAVETICTVSEGCEVDDVLNRERCFIAKAPQTFILREILQLQEKSRLEGLMGTFTDSASLMKHYGKRLHIVKGNNSNIKITTQQDYELMKAVIAKGNAERILK